jgi:hypothetical protein
LSLPGAAAGELGMAETSREPGSADRAFWSWLGFWLQFLLLGVLALTGAGFASLGGRPGDYATGMLIFLGALALAFLRLKRHLDGGDAGWGDFLFVDDMTNLAVAIPLFAILGLAGLFVARAWPYGSLHAAGIGLFAASAIIIFLDIKQVFDHIDAGHE